MAGIIIPTYNRSGFLLRQLDYYASRGCEHTIYIGDSSNELHSNMIRNKCDQLRDKLQIVYEFVPKSSAFAAIFRAASLVKEKFCCVIGDDDFQVPRSVSRSEMFLDQNPDYASARGRAYIFTLFNNGLRGRLAGIQIYLQPSLESNSAVERLTQFFKTYYCVMFSVYRTADFLRRLEATKLVKDKSFSDELLPGALTIVEGKSKTLDCLSFIRQNHIFRTSVPTHSEWINGPDYQTSNEIFTDKVSHAILVREKLDLELARRAVTQAFSGQLKAGELNEKSSNTALDLKLWIRANVPGMEAVARLRKLYQIKRKSGEFAILREDGPDYSDFFPIYQLISDVAC